VSLPEQENHGVTLWALQKVLIIISCRPTNLCRVAKIDEFGNTVVVYGNWQLRSAPTVTGLWRDDWKCTTMKTTDHWDQIHFCLPFSKSGAEKQVRQTQRLPDQLFDKQAFLCFTLYQLSLTW